MMKPQAYLEKLAIVLVLSPVFAGAPAFAEEAFQVNISDRQKMVKEAACTEAVGKQNKYKSGIRTTTIDAFWACSEPELCKRDGWVLKFDRSGPDTANGGRCATIEAEAISGDGTFSAEMYIDKSVGRSTGVFTIAILPTPFNIKQELDLIVVNVAPGVAKFGKPGRSAAVQLSDIAGQWQRLSLVKTGQVCNFTIQNEEKRSIILNGLSCELQNQSNRIVINSRSRSGEEGGSSFVRIRNVKWESK